MNGVGICILIALLILSCAGCKPDDVIVSTGAIAGSICDPDIGGIGRGNVQIVIQSESWNSAATSQTGQFLITGVPCGLYRIKAFKPGYQSSEESDVRVASDSISIVQFKIFNIVLPFIPPPARWIETDSTLLPLDDYLQSGKLFEMRCK